jgi:deoxyadenosine/deoxycytidine kinase
MKNSLSNIFFDDHIKIVNGNQWNEIVKSLIKLDSNNEKLLDRIFFRNSKYNNNNRNYIVATERDAI